VRQSTLRIAPLTQTCSDAPAALVLHERKMKRSPVFGCHRQILAIARLSRLPKKARKHIVA
jgi:hypothetical protein